MQSEKLSIAARAAGYAMAVSDDLLTTTRRETPGQPDAWRAGEIKPLSDKSFTPEPSDWRRDFYHLIGWDTAA